MSEDNVALLFEVGLYATEFLLEFSSLNAILVHLLKQAAKQLAHVEHVLEGFQDGGYIQEALIGDGC